METLLLIEDDKDNRENMAELLELEGYKVHTAKDGQQGYDMISIFMPKLIISDIRMPKMDGFELLSKLKCHPEYKNIPLIFLTAKSEKLDISRGLACGASAYVVKPTELNELLASIRQCLQAQEN